MCHDACRPDSIMKKYTSVFCAALFACGVVIVPALHLAGLCFSDTNCTAAHSHADRDHEGKPSGSGEKGHDSDNCAICQLAATPSIVSCAAVQVATHDTPVQLIMPADDPIYSHIDSHPFLARGPPVLLSI